jgi:hypothetical protein
MVTVKKAVTVQQQELTQAASADTTIQQDRHGAARGRDFF